MPFAGNLRQCIDSTHPINWQHSLNRGLVSWWLPHPTGGTGFGSLKWQDLCRRNSGTLTNGPTWTAGPNGFGAVELDGSNDYVLGSRAVSFANTQPHTLSARVRCSTLTFPLTWGWIVGAGDSSTGGTAMVLRSSTGVLEFFYQGGNFVASSGVSVSEGVWAHVACVWDTAGVSYYKDGVFDSIDTIATTWSAATAATRLGDWQGSGFVLPAALTDARIFERALSASEVAALYDQSRKGHPDTLQWVSTKRFFSPLQNQPVVGSYGLLDFIGYAVGDGTQLGIQFDAASNSGYQAATATYTWDHTCLGANRFLSVDISMLSAGQTVISITYNGDPLSLIVARSTVTSIGRIECWGLVNPDSGTHTIEVTLSGSIASTGTAVSYAGVHQISPTEGVNSAQATNVGAADAEVTITTVAENDWIHAALATDDGNVTAEQTARNEVNGAAGSGANEDTGPVTPPAAIVMSYTDIAGLATWAIAGYGIRPVAASSLTSYRFNPSWAKYTNILLAPGRY